MRVDLYNSFLSAALSVIQLKIQDGPAARWAVGRFENPGVAVLFEGYNPPPSLVRIGLTDLPKSGGAMPPLAPTGLQCCCATVRLPPLPGDLS